MRPFAFLPTHLPLAPRPVAGELLSSWLGRLAAANALEFEELLEVLRVRLGRRLPAGQAPPGRLDYACSARLVNALATLSRLPASSIAALDLKRRFGALGLWWFSHETHPLYDARHRLIHQAQILPGYCVECLREQAQRGEPAHLRAEWALAFLTHCPRHRGALWSRCSGCREVASLGWGLGRGQPPTLGCRRCVLEPGITFLGPPAPLSAQEEWVLALEAALLGAVGGPGRDPQAPEPGWVGPIGPADFMGLVGELIEMLGWPDARGGLYLREHLRQGSCSAPDYLLRPLPAAPAEFSTLERQGRFEVLAGVVELLGLGTGEESRRGALNPFCCLYGPMSASGRRKFLARLRGWPEPVRVKALAAVACFRSASKAQRRRGARALPDQKRARHLLNDLTVKRAGG